jgi:tetratricopeptide (TPR) repeat protein
VSAPAARVAQLRGLRRYDDAEQEARTALSADPQDPALLAELAAVLLDAERCAEGLAAADAAVAVAPQWEYPHRLRALLLSRLDRHQEALLAGYTAVGLAPEEPGTALGYAVVLQRAGRLDDALQVAHRAVALAPGEAPAHLRLADIASDRGDRALARRAYEETLRLDPENAWARHDLAVLDLAERRAGAALRGLVEAGRLDPANPLVLRNVAAVLWRLAWRLRILLVAATLAVLAAGAGGGTAPARVAALSALAVVGLLAWRTARDLPGSSSAAVRAALRADLPLALTAVALAGCVALLAAAGATGSWILAAPVWLLLGGLGVVASVVGIARRLRRR